MDLQSIYQNPKFELYFNLLVEWNKKFNLTAITDRDSVYLKHFFDSVLPADLFASGANVLDIGSGAGFPGICLKIVRPDLNITLLDSVGKKVTFLSTVISELRLSGITAVKSRIEDFKQKDFDVVTARAVAPCSTLAEYCLPFVRRGGFALFYKSAAVDDELKAANKAISILGGKLNKVVKIPLDESTLRHFVLIDKITLSPPSYPRGGNKPRLNPL